MPYVKPSNKVLVAGDPIVDECVTEGTLIKPKLLVIKGAGDHQIGLAGADARNVLGVADYDPRYNIEDAFPDKHPVRVLKGNIVVVLTLAESQTVNKGDRLKAAANGQVQLLPGQAVNEGGTGTYTLYFDLLVAYAEESVSTGAGETKSIMARLVI